MLNRLQSLEQSKILHMANVFGTILGALIGIVFGYKLGGLIGAIAGVWFVSVIVGLLFYGLAKIVCLFIEPEDLNV